ncbi:MAG TPA: 8-amino-7-oxononanoate synthase [Ignavibacteriales bacterium]|nr:8-amino-7-oxononanoate synthase [Ignavibacteriales bacterium]HPP33162.1 8-amino-7-oxononanoate synthase [Ignavibacteriales bacterium]
MANKYVYFEEKINLLKNKNQLRTLKDVEYKQDQFIKIENKNYLNLSSNDYLGIGSNIHFQNEFFNYLNENKLNDAPILTSSSSRLLTGNSKFYTELDNLITNTYQKEKCLVFNSGYHINIGLLSSLADKGDVIFSDKLNHASIIDGLKLSNADFYRYNHLNYEHLESLLQKHRNNYRNAIIVTESVFSMDGDIANLQKLVELKEKYNCLLYVDEAHAVGVFGEKGLGICEEMNVIDKIDIITGTFGKALASIGAFCVVNEILYQYIINTARSLIFTTALPPLNLLWTKFVFEKIVKMKKEREYLKNLSYTFKDKLKNLNLSTISQSQIIPIIIGDNEKTLNFAKIFQENDILLMAIRPPTVPEGTSRLRISLTSNITDINLSRIFDIFNQLKLVE